MPSLEQMDRNQKALLWAKSGNDSYGEMMRSAPVEIDVRWVWKRRQVVDADGNALAVDATIITDRVIKEGSLMWLGTQADFLGSGSDDPELELVQVLTMGRTEDILGKPGNVRYEVAAAYYRSTQPSP